MNPLNVLDVIVAVTLRDDPTASVGSLSSSTDAKADLQEAGKEARQISLLYLG